MKKNLFYLFAIVFMAVGVTACSSSDNDKEMSIEGKWTFVRYVEDKTNGVILSVESESNATGEAEEIFGQIKSFSPMVGILLSNLLQSVVLDTDKSVTASYNGQEINGISDIAPLLFAVKDDIDWVSSSKGLASYENSKGNLYLKLNAEAIIKEANIAPEMHDIIKSSLKNPIRLKYTVSNNTLDCYLDKSCVQELLKELDLDALLKLIPGDVELPVEISTDKILEYFGYMKSLQVGVKFTK